MPPKKRVIASADEEEAKKTKVDTTSTSPPPTTTTSTTTTTTSTSTSSSSSSTDIKTDKDKGKDKLKDDDIIDSDEEAKSKLPKCRYGPSCYRKNPEHLKEFWHPKAKSGDSSTSTSSGSTSGTTPLKKSESKLLNPSKGDADLDEKGAVQLENYKNVLRIVLGKSKISVDEKRMLREFRKQHSITDQHHFLALAQFGWTEDEYDDGERKDDNIDLEVERKVLLDPSGFEIFWLERKDLKKMTKEQENVFSRVCTRFFQTMARAQSNYIVSKVGVIANSPLRTKFNTRLQAFRSAGKADLEWGFHGTSEESISAISKTGFLTPDEIQKLKNEKAAKTGGGKKSAPKVKPKLDIEVLDDGFFGKGIYFSFYSDYAMYYSQERSSSQILLSQILVGKAYKCTTRMDGSDVMKGFDSHYSPKGNEVVIFQPDQILPRYIITFEENEDEEREQEF
eukprot:TRINITY_DN5781_c0_g2_i1.p1 TRINITY_DN5781_c0_g2~~TRINITY_DN5781_c0_g2_i1.p1  ORF type:complete len:451 (-),score=105.37 TRINITY_DN5781_c0_g2_i1:85-1437(-)